MLLISSSTSLTHVLEPPEYSLLYWSCSPSNVAPSKNTAKALTVCFGCPLSLKPRILLGTDPSHPGLLRLAGSLPVLGVIRKPPLVQGSRGWRCHEQALPQRPHLLPLPGLQHHCQQPGDPLLLLRAVLLHLGRQIPCGPELGLYYRCCHRHWLHHVFQILCTAFSGSQDGDSSHQELGKCECKI